jgi:hypothetical protein
MGATVRKRGRPLEGSPESEALMEGHSLNIPAPVFEQSTSPLVQSNDGLVYLRRDAGGYMLTYDPTGETLLFTYQREIADAYIAGYDEARRTQ